MEEVKNYLQRINFTLVGEYPDGIRFSKGAITVMVMDINKCDVDDLIFEHKNELDPKFQISVKSVSGDKANINSTVCKQDDIIKSIEFLLSLN